MKGRYRRIVVRGGRRYAVCGLAARPALPPRVSDAPRIRFWLPGATLALVLAFTAYIIGRPPAYPTNFGNAVPRGTLAHYTINDFANASR